MCWVYFELMWFLNFKGFRSGCGRWCRSTDAARLQGVIYREGRTATQLPGSDSMFRGKWTWSICWRVYFCSLGREWSRRWGKCPHSRTRDLRRRPLKAHPGTWSARKYGWSKRKPCALLSDRRPGLRCSHSGSASCHVFDISGRPGFGRCSQRTPPERSTNWTDVCISSSVWVRK